jgi:hypothetical protein
MKNHIVILSSIHPKKLNKIFWECREIEYLNSFHLLKNYNDYTIIDNTINDNSQIINQELYQVINNFEFPIVFSNNIYNQELYSLKNDFGLVLMLKYFQNYIKPNVNYIFVNGRIGNYENILKKGFKNNFKDTEFFYESIHSNSVFSDLFIINSSYFNRFIKHFENFNECDSFNEYLINYINIYKSNVFKTNLNILKYYHNDDINYLSTKLKIY